jgi:hypothetical protein
MNEWDGRDEASAGDSYRAGLHSIAHRLADAGYQVRTTAAQTEISVYGTALIGWRWPNGRLIWQDRPSYLTARYGGPGQGHVLGTASPWEYCPGFDRLRGIAQWPAEQPADTIGDYLLSQMTPPGRQQVIVYESPNMLPWYEDECGGPREFPDDLLPWWEAWDSTATLSARARRLLHRCLSQGIAGPPRHRFHA